MIDLLVHDKDKIAFMIYGENRNEAWDQIKTCFYKAMGRSLFKMGGEKEGLFGENSIRALEEPTQIIDYCKTLFANDPSTVVYFTAKFNGHLRINSAADRKLLVDTEQNIANVKGGKWCERSVFRMPVSPGNAPLPVAAPPAPVRHSQPCKNPGLNQAV